LHDRYFLTFPTTRLSRVSKPARFQPRRAARDQKLQCFGTSHAFTAPALTGQTANLSTVATTSNPDRPGAWVMVNGCAGINLQNGAGAKNIRFAALPFTRLYRNLFIPDAGNRIFTLYRLIGTA